MKPLLDDSVPKPRELTLSHRTRYPRSNPMVWTIRSEYSIGIGTSHSAQDLGSHRPIAAMTVPTSEPKK